VATTRPKHRHGNGLPAAQDDGWRKTLHRLYESSAQRSRRFRYGLLVFDLVTIAFVVSTSFIPNSLLIEAVDVVFGLAILADFIARMAISRTPGRDLLHPSSWADIAAIGSFLAPVMGEGFAFLRILRTLRLLRSYRMLARLRADSAFFRLHEDAIFAVTNLAVFVFITTGFVFETQHDDNPAIQNWTDALYFTVTALTTTGFGDITLPGMLGRLTSVVIMLCGVTLFLNLVRALLSPTKVRFRCKDCGLTRHDVDAVHCKACGAMLNLPNEGL
jgi:voltage-gated potassium channel